MIELYHTSPQEITRIDEHGRFGEFLFFSCSVYAMVAGEYVTYTIDVDADDMISAGSLFYHEEAGKLDSLIAKFCERFDVDIDTAEEIISGRKELDGCDADDGWDVQLFAARAAKLLGFRGVVVADEQGAAYMIDMQGREAELERVDNP